MRSARSTLACLTTATVLAIPVAVVMTFQSGAQGAGGAETLRGETRVCTHGPLPANRHETSVKFLNFDRTRGYGSKTAIRGQVIANVGAGRGSVPNATVKLYRQINGTSGWKPLGHDRTTYPSRAPKFGFKVRSKANARYKVVFEATHRCKGSSNETSVSVYRHFDAQLEDGTGRFHGKVSPAYSHKRIYLEKRTCPDCGWDRVRSAKTGKKGSYSFQVGAPAHGRWWWRVSTPASERFIRSYSSVFTTARG
jgi:hypothetical protein